jgi:hypothetical protein
MSPLLGREGLNDVVDIFNKENDRWWPKMVDEVDTTDYFYRILQAGDLGAAVAMNEATGVNYDEFQTPFTKDYYPVKRGVGWAASTEVTESDKYGVTVKAKGLLMMNSINRTIEADVANFMNQMTDTSTANLGPDGKPLISASHPLYTGVQSNILNVADGAATTNYLALGVGALEQALTQAMQQVSHRGQPMAMSTGKYDIWVPVSLSPYATRIVTAGGLAGTNTHDENWSGKRIGEIIGNPYFTSQTNWLIRASKDTKHGLKFVSRRKERANVQYDIDKDVWKHVLNRIWVKGIFDWRGVVGSPA